MTMETEVSVYILKLSNGDHYTGITNNIPKRLKQHQKGESKFTSRFLPVTLIHSEKYPNRRKARKKEVYIKQKGARRFLLSLKYKTIPPH